MLRDNTIIGGQAANGGFAFGGGLITDSTNATLDSIELIGNAAISGASSTNQNAGGPSGGGAYITSFNSGTGYQVQITNSIFANNRLEVGSPGSSIGGGGAGLVVQALTADIIHSTFADNYFVGDLQVGQAILVHGLYGASGTPATANINYTIIADHVHPYTDNTSAITVAEGSTINLYRGMFAGNTNNINTNNKPLPPGTITGLNTMHSASSIAFVSPGAPDYNYHLSSASPAIDLAVGSGVTVDIDGQARPVSTHADIGADEYSGPVYLYLPFITRK